MLGGKNAQVVSKTGDSSIAAAPTELFCFKRFEQLRRR
jgi:hypothetical protein